MTDVPIRRGLCTRSTGRAGSAGSPTHDVGPGCHRFVPRSTSATAPYPPADFDEVAYAALPVAEQQARYQAVLERLLDEIAFPVLRKYGMRVEWNRKQPRRIRVTGAHGMCR